ncbi:unnamed protein product [Adineta steineri]|uniref:Uncharacterized protein n=1 Tax=Adineta steineri TaxID=433720 RepID=A0A814YW87_9BILA|nr:unnamed protein product [Adineta steineri]
MFFFFLFLFRTSGGSIDRSSIVQNRHVSLANIATAFISERKSSSRRQSSAPRKKRLTKKGQQISTKKRSSIYSSGTDEILDHRSSLEIMQGGISTIFPHSDTTTSADNKHRSAVH